METKTIEQITKYVYENYRTYKNKELIIIEHNSHFSVKKHIDGSPLVLGNQF
jgi:hypothetical protein